MTTKPVVTCIIARPLANGGIGKSRIVSLATAYLALRAGFAVVGPDPQTVEALATWQREQEPAPFNHPRMP